MLDEKLVPKYKDRVAFEHRDFPLAKHSWARKAAIVGRFFHEQNPATGLEFRRFALFNLKAITPDNFQAKVTEFAKKAGEDPAKALASLEDKRLAEIVDKEYQEGVARGVAKTPTAFVNGQPFVETFTVEEISKAIEVGLAPTPATGPQTR
jgi:protein-disulfide isomerase